jgi:tRNA (Thr-GGU) A37 N-methylase
MKLEIEPIGRVEGARELATDDYWGRQESSIVLDDRFEPEALQGLGEFSHVEVIFFFDRVDPAKIVTGARHPRWSRELMERYWDEEA